MRPVAEYLLLKTRRQPAALSEDEIKALRSINARHTPARVLAEIDRDCRRFTAKGRPLDKLTFCYVAKVLENQRPTLKRKKAPKAAGPAPEAPRDLKDLDKVVVSQSEFSEEEKRQLLEEARQLEQELAQRKKARHHG